MHYFLLLFLSVLISLTGNSCSKPASSKVYRIGRDPSWYSLDLGNKSAAVFAFSDDLLQSVAFSEGLKFEFVSVGWDSLLASLDKHQVDGILSSVQPILGYKDKYAFSTPYLMLGPVLLVPITSNITSLSQMSGKEVGVQQGSSYVPLLQNDGSIVIRTYETPVAALNDLSSDLVDGVLMENLQAYAFLNDGYKQQIKIVTAPLNDDALRLVTLINENDELMRSFNHALETMHKDGTYEMLLEKWHLH